MQNLQRLSLPELAAKAESNRAATDFVAYARLLALAENPIDAITVAEVRGGFSERVVNTLKAAVPAGGTSDPAWAGNLASHSQMSNAFLDSLAGRSIFDTIWPSMVAAPARERIAIATGAVEGHVVGEAAVTPLHELAFAAGELEERHIVAIVVASRELLEGGSRAAQRLFDTELRKGIARATDRTFISVASSGVTPVPSSGNDAVAAYADLTALLLGVTGSDLAAYFFVVTGDLAKHMAGMVNAAGIRVFPEMGPAGGTALGVPVLVCDVLAENTVLAFDAGQFAGDRGEVVVDSSKHAAVQMNSTPSPENSLQVGGCGTSH